MIPTTVVPKVVRPPTDEELVAQLVRDRGECVERISAAWRQVTYWTGRSHAEVMHWCSIARSRQIDLDIIDASLSFWRAPKDERYADLRAQMRHEDQTREVVSDGSTNWEAL